MKIPISARGMLQRTGLVLIALGLSFLANPAAFPSGPEKPKIEQSAGKPQEPDTSKVLPNGIEVRHAGLLLQVLALRDDVLRVRLSSNGELPEDASWAVLAEVRHQRVEVTPDATPDTVGFHTTTLSVRIDRATLRLSTTDLQGNVLQEDADGWPVEFHSGAFRVYKKMPPDEHFFGLGDKVGPLDRRGQSFRLWNTDAFCFQESTDPIYKSIPFFMTMRAGRSMGFLLDNTWSTSFDFGKSERNTYSFGAEGGPIDYYVFYGPDPKQVVQTYAWLTGLPPLPPLWSLGFQQSRFSYETESRVREIASRLRADKIPADVLYLDIDFQKEHRPFTVDAERFPHFEQMLSDLTREDFHVVAITDLHIARLPGAGYAPYDTGIAADNFVKNPDGSAYVGTVWPGPSVFPEFTQKKTRDWWGSLYKQFLSEGLAGFWNDMNEPSVFLTDNLTMPDNVQHRIDEPGFRPRTTSHLEIHNVYGMENSRATYEGLRKLDPNLRPFVLTRATYAGGQRYAATWTGDNTSSWDHLRLTTPMLLNLGLSGFGMSGADVGGFIGTPGPALLTRWTELATFQPIDRNHTNKGSGDKEVWVHGPEQEAIRRRYIEERYRLMPYLYTLVEELSRTGLPVVRPLFLEFPRATKDLQPLDLKAGNEFLFGPDLLVAPPPFPEQPEAYALKLPPGVWYDYWTGEKVQQTTTPDGADAAEPRIQPKLDILPVYVREGSIIPLQPLVQSTEEKPQGPLTLRVYPGKDCRGYMYLDDGKTLAYTRGEFLRLEFSCTVTPTGVELKVGERKGSYLPWWKTIHLEVYDWQSPAGRVTLKQKPGALPDSVDPARHVLTLELNDDPRGSDLEILRVN
ncbi:MAG TPA: glycoside hydrolase family 31 protein [Candidatus Acidoferrales bacterium]|nr:glycoside hydrolase family 31 protein [Candidatus Acidoferrales bacterium]